MKQREIKFRAWDNVDYMSKPFTLNDIVHNRISFASDATIMQYTGRKDEKDVEIYEGDIVRCGNGDIDKVEWGEHDACFNVSGYYSQSDDYPTMAFIEGGPFEVLGNVHQNPDLLK